MAISSNLIEMVYNAIKSEGRIMRYGIFMLLLISSRISIGQALSPVENFILSLLAKDTATSGTIYFIPEIKFGLTWKGHSYIAAAKNKHDLFFILAGTQQVYEINNSGNSLTRIDSSYHFGDNYNCMTFLVNDTLFQYGGYGFWQNRDFFSRFDKVTGQWEYIQGGDLMGNRLTLNYLNRNNNNFYVFGQYVQNTSKDFNAEFRDSIYRYNLNSKRWECLGKIKSSWIKDMYQKVEMHNSTFYTPWGLCVMSPVTGMFHLFDFENNQVIPMKRNRFDSLAKLFRSAQHNLHNPSYFHIYLSDTLHYVAMDKDQYTHIQTKLDSGSFDFQSKIPIYTPVEKQKLTSSVISFSRYKFYGFLALLILLPFTLMYIVKFRKRKNQPMVNAREIPSVINKAGQQLLFLSSLSEVEKLFLTELMEYSRKNKKMSVDLINRLLGVSHKDYESQKVRRSHVINRINENYRRVFQTDQTLIQKVKNDQDRRAFDYYIPADLIPTLS